MLQINKMAEAIVKLIADVERLQAEIKELKECSQPVVVPADIDVEAIISSRPGRIVPILYQEVDKVKNKLSDDEILHRTKLHNEIKERTAQRLNKGG